MTIRPAVASDVPEIVAMALRFGSEADYRDAITLSEPHVTTLVERLIAADDGTVIVAQAAAGDLIGMIALHAFEHPMSGERTAAELAWWVEPVARGRVGLLLLRHAEAWAKAQQARALTMIAPTERVEQFYARVGYTPIERAYQRRV